MVSSGAAVKTVWLGETVICDIKVFGGGRFQAAARQVKDGDCNAAAWRRLRFSGCLKHYSSHSIGSSEQNHTAKRLNALLCGSLAKVRV